MRWLGLFFAFIMILTACDSGDSVIQSDTSGDTESSCPTLVQDAVKAVDNNCEGVARNQICYGNLSLQAETRTNVALNNPGDVVDLDALQRLEISPMDVSTGVWGIAMMKLQTSMVGTTPGQAVTFLLFGDVALENRDLTDSGVQSFYFSSGIGDAQCNEAPDSGILVQTPDGVANITLSLNDVEVVLESTAFVQAQPNSDMTVNVLEGQAQVTAGGETQSVPAGSRTRIGLNADGVADSPPTVPEPYDIEALRPLPITTLDNEITIAETLYMATFAEGTEEWGIFQDGTDLEAFPAEGTSDGYVCAVDRGAGVYWYFDAPEAWLGDRSDMYNGTLNYRIRQQDVAGKVAGVPDILLVSDELTLQFEFPMKPLLYWTSYHVTLHEQAGWTTDGTTPATRDDLMQALGNLTALHIRGEYVSGNDSACLDGVRFIKGGFVSSNDISTKQWSSVRIDGVPDALIGWNIYQDGTDLEYVPSDGISRGYICSTDRGSGVYWYFEMPERWMGNRGDLYDGVLQYRIRQQDTAGDDASVPDILLVGDGITLQYSFENKPTLEWTPFTIRLNEDAGWTTSDGATPSSDEFREVLENLMAVRIRGEYLSGADSACLDGGRLVPPR